MMNKLVIDPITLAETLSTRLCHDLAGPISAVNNGIELISDTDTTDDNMQNEIMSMLHSSSTESLTKLQMLRMAFGKASAQTLCDVDEIQDITNRFFNSARLSVDWPTENLGGFENKISTHKRRILSLMILIVANSLVFGGTLQVRKNHNQITITGEHDRIKDEPDFVSIFSNSSDQAVDLTTYNIFAYYLLHLTSQPQEELFYQNQDNKIELTINFL